MSKYHRKTKLRLSIGKLDQSILIYLIDHTSKMLKQTVKY